MPQRRRFQAGSHRSASAAVLAITLIASAAFGIGGIQPTQEAGLEPIAASITTSSFDDGATVVVEDSAVPTQGEATGPRSVKEFGSDEPFSLFALSWEGQRDLATFFRAQQADGSWGPWYDAEPLNEKEGTRSGTEPIYLEATHKVQVAVHGESTDPGIEAVFIDGRASEGGIALTADTDGMPNIVSRAGWRADESIRCNAPTYDDETNAITIHHTAGSNNYTKEEAAGIVRGIYQYHAQQLGWCDIGYHSLVDKYGTIYEGRAGGLTKSVQGAHAGGFNENTWAISMLGNYQEATPTDVMLQSVGELAGWRAKVAGFDPKGDNVHYSEGTSYSKYAYGQSVTLPNIFAHRDVGNTECPGDYVYEKMDTIRDVAKRKYDALNHTQQPDPTTTSGAPTAITADEIADAPISTDSTSPIAEILKDPELPTSMGTLLATGVGLLATEGRLPETTSTLENIDTIDGLQLKDIPATINTRLAYTGNNEFAATWRRVNDAFGGILGQPRGGIHAATPMNNKNSAIQYVPFENGIIVSSPEAGTHALWGKIGDAWAAQGFDAGPLGMPLSEEHLVDDLVQVDFQGGYVTFDPKDGAIAIHPN